MATKTNPATPKNQRAPHEAAGIQKPDVEVRTVDGEETGAGFIFNSDGSLGFTGNVDEAVRQMFQAVCGQHNSLIQSQSKKLNAVAASVVAMQGILD